MTVILLASLIGFAGLVSAAGPGDQQWDYILNPTDSTYKIASGSGPIDMVFNGGMGYLIESGYGLPTVRGRVFSTNNYAQYWSSKATTYQAASGWLTSRPPVAIAVAADNNQCIAVTDGVNVWLSNDGGGTWSNLPTVTLGTGCVITDVAVGPVRSGLLLDREYVVSTANSAAANVTGGDVKILGASATWASMAIGIADSNDYLSVDFSPNYLGDRTVVAIGGNNTQAKVQEFKSATAAVIPIDSQDITTTPAAYDLGSAAALQAGSVALPSDFDPSTTSGNVVFVGCTITGSTGGVFKVTPGDDTAKNILSANVNSVAYSGTTSSGTLFAGYYSTNDVKRSDNPLASNPDWTNTSKKPTGEKVTVVLDSSYATNQRLFAMTAIDRLTTTGGSAVSVSTDGGVSFTQWSMIDYKGTYTAGDSNVGSIEQFVVTADEKDAFFITNDMGGKTAAADTPPTYITGNLHVWDAPLALSSTTWEQKLTIPGTSTSNVTSNTALIALNPAWATTKAIYVCDNTLTSASTFYVSKNGGATWTTRNGPATTSRVDAIAVIDENTVVAAAGSKAFKSTNSAWTWNDGVSVTSGTLNIAASADGATMVMGRPGGIYYSVSKGDTWSTNSLGLTGTTGYYAAIDANYAINQTYFVAGTDGSVLRRGPADAAFVSISPSSLLSPGTTNPVLKFGNGTMYVLTANGVLRNMDYLNANPATVMGAWEKMDALASSFFYTNANLPGFGMDYQGPLNNLAITGGYDLLVSNKLAKCFSYRDFLAANAPVATTPADGAEVTIDPNTGSGNQVTFAWNTLGSGTGVPNLFQIEWAEVGSTTTTTGAFGVNDIGAPAINSTTLNLTLRADTTYNWRLRVRDELSGDQVRSPWSATRTIKVLSGTMVIQTQAGPILLSPIGTTSSLKPGFSWAPISNATSYQFILATDAGLTNTVAGTPATVNIPAFGLTTDLTAGTTYFWAVRASAPTLGVQSFGSFTATAPAATTSAAPNITVSVPPITIPQSTVTVTGGGSTISPILVWVVIVIGAILIIAVLVLIVRTRRPL